MQITFAYTNDATSLEDIGNALGNGTAKFFTLDVASVTPIIPIRAKAYRWELADGSMRVLKTATRKKTSFTTLPNLFLANVLSSNIPGTQAVQALTDWFFAESLWINTGFLIDTTATGGFVRVIPTNDELTIEAFQAIIIAQRCSIDIETVYPN